MAEKRSSGKRPGTKPPAKSRFSLQKFLHYFYWVLAVVSLLGAVGVVGYYAGYNQAKSDDAKVVAAHKAENRKLRTERAKLSNETAKHEYAEGLEKQIDRPLVKKRDKSGGRKGELAIIFDDVAFRGDVQHIKGLGLPVTMSFLPPTSRHPDSAELAEKEPYYMVHLPMEAMNFHSPEKLTLLTTDSKETVIERIAEVKKLFPRVEYINNHTGSKFTSDEQAMNRLIFALRKEQIGFVDSRTTAESKVKKVMNRYKMPYLARDVFLDHDDDVAAIKSQIVKAIHIANKYGRCIAICHPHKATLQALRESKALFNGVELVRIDKFAK